MTVAKLHRVLSGFIADGHGRARVCVSKETFWHPLEADGCTILDLEQCYLQYVPQTDDDGGQKYRADGTECLHKCCVLEGNLSQEEVLAAKAAGEKP